MGILIAVGAWWLATPAFAQEAAEEPAATEPAAEEAAATEPAADEPAVEGAAATEQAEEGTPPEAPAAEEPTEEQSAEPPPPPPAPGDQAEAELVIESEDAPISAWEALERLPPRSSWNVALHISIARVGYWREDTSAWVGFGLRGEWGRVLSSGHRFGTGLVFSAEGPIPLYWSAAVEPEAIWDWVGAGGLQVGASVGPAVMFHNILELTGTKTTVGVAPMAAVRLGYSESWSRVGRRFFVLLEPKGRWLVNGLDWSVALVIGSGSGR